MEITTAYQKERHDFGRSIYHLAFSSVDILEESGAGLLKEHIDATRPSSTFRRFRTSSSATSTPRRSYKSIGMLHLEGLAQEVDCTEKDQTVRYKKIGAVHQAGEVARRRDRGRHQAELRDQHLRGYFAGEYADHSSEPPNAKTLSVFQDPSEIKRTVSNIRGARRQEARGRLRHPAVPGPAH